MGRIPLQKDVEAWALRENLVELLRAKKTYKNCIAQDLKPLWKQTKWPRDAPAFGEIGEEDSYPEPERAYVAMVRTTVAKSGFTHDGVAPEWLCKYVHEDVSGYRVPPMTFWSMPPVAFNLSVSITPSFASITYEGPVDGKVVLRLQAEGIGDFANWDGFRKALRETADTQLDHAIACILVEQKRLRNPSAVANVRESDIPQLFDLLFSGTPVPDRADRERLRRAAELISLDLP